MSKKKEKVEEPSDDEPVVEVERHHFHQRGRFYQDEFPQVEENVIVQVLKIDDKIGAYVSLLEYDGKEGMINLSEISKRRIRSMSKLLRIGSTEVCTVVSVDENKGYINLSKKRVAPEDIAPKQEQFARAKAVHGIMQHVASINSIDVGDLCAKVSWPLHGKFPSVHDAFKQHINEEINLWEYCDFSQPGESLEDKADKLKEDIEANLRRRLIQSMVRLQAKVDVSCSEYDGVEAVREALSEGFKASKEECEVNIKLIAHPLFALSCMCRDKELGVSILEEAIAKIEIAIKAKGGDFEVRSKPSIAQKEDPNKGGESDTSSSKEASDQEDMGDLDDEAKKALDAIKVDDSDDEKDGDKKKKGGD